MAKAKAFPATVSVRLTAEEHVALRAYAAARDKPVSEIVRGMVRWAVMPDELAEAVVRVGRERRALAGAPAPKGLFRLGEDVRIRHLDEGSVLEGVDVEGNA